MANRQGKDTDISEKEVVGRPATQPPDTTKSPAKRGKRKRDSSAKRGPTRRSSRKRRTSHDACCTSPPFHPSRRLTSPACKQTTPKQHVSPPNTRRSKPGPKPSRTKSADRENRTKTSRKVRVKSDAVTHTTSRKVRGQNSAVTKKTVTKSAVTRSAVTKSAVDKANVRNKRKVRNTASSTSSQTLDKSTSKQGKHKNIKSSKKITPKGNKRGRKRRRNSEDEELAPLVQTKVPRLDHRQSDVNSKRREVCVSLLPTDDDVYTVGKILGWRNGVDEREFLIRWEGYSSDWDTWEPEENVLASVS